MKLSLSLFLLGLLMVGASLLLISCHGDDGRPRNCDGLYTEKELDDIAVHTFHVCQMMFKMGTFSDTMAPPAFIRHGDDWRGRGADDYAWANDPKYQLLIRAQTDSILNRARQNH